MGKPYSKFPMILAEVFFCTQVSKMKTLCIKVNCILMNKSHLFSTVLNMSCHAADQIALCDQSDSMYPYAQQYYWQFVTHTAAAKLAAQRRQYMAKNFKQYLITCQACLRLKDVTSSSHTDMRPAIFKLYYINQDICPNRLSHAPPYTIPI